MVDPEKDDDDKDKKSPPDQSNVEKKEDMHLKKVKVPKKKLTEKTKDFNSKFQVA